MKEIPDNRWKMAHLKGLTETEIEILNWVYFLDQAELDENVNYDINNNLSY
jgi:hypothetical protein